MKIHFSYYTVSRESVDLGLFLDHGIYNPTTNSRYSDGDHLQQAIMRQPSEYCFRGSLDEALEHVVRLNCNIQDYYPSSFNDKLSFSSALKFYWYICTTAICYNVIFEDITVEESAYIRLRLKEISSPQNWLNSLFVRFH